MCTREEHAGQLPPHPSGAGFSHHLRGSCRCGMQHAPGPIVVPEERWQKGSKRRRYPAPLGVIDRYHVYYGVDGRPVHRTVRYRDPKDFRQEHYEHGEWKPGLGDVQRHLYRLPQLLASSPETLVFLPEGEKDCDRLASLGLVATTYPNGALSWERQYSEWLTGRRVVLIEDNDRDGRRRVERLADHLRDVTAMLKIVSFPYLPEGGDISDWLDIGGKIADLVRQIEEHPSETARTAS